MYNDTYRLRILISTLVILLYWTYSAQSQTDTATRKRISVFPLPLVYNTLETSWAFGAAAVASFNWDSLSPPSQVQLGGAYTLNDQILLYTAFQLFACADQWRLNGELGFYRYSYFYYGIGNNFADYSGELYSVDFPRLRLNGLYRISTHQLVGLRYYLDAWQVYDQLPDGLLLAAGTVGNQQSVFSALGPLWQYDSRDHLFFPTRGAWVEAALGINHRLLGATQNFVKWTLDARKYQQLRDDHILVGRLYLEGNTGQPAFSHLALLGGTRLLRG